MKHLKDFINESKKNIKIPKHDKLGGKKYKIKDKKFHQGLEDHMKDFFKKKLKIKEELSEDDKEALYEITMDAVKEFISNAIDNWKSYWESYKDAEEDLDTAEDWFWNELDSHIGDIYDLCEEEDFEFNEDDVKQVINDNEDDINDIIGEEVSYTYDCGLDNFDDADDYYGRHNNDDDDDDNNDEDDD